MPPEEIRFGVVLNGGVSLAVWMGGTVRELDRLTKARERSGPSSRPDPYAVALELVGGTARADVIAGTSAGGINGAALALTQVTREADPGILRDLWIGRGRLEALLRSPFQGDPRSLLQGDEYFLPALREAMRTLAAADGAVDPERAPMDLTITCTVLGGNQSIARDSTGELLPQTVHAGRFRWRRMPRTAASLDAFGPTRLASTVEELALAARATASFPIAFEPAFVPVSSELAAQGRPDMAGVVENWGTLVPGVEASRYVVDGGVLANTPTVSALRAVEAMPALGPVRRVMLLVYPHAPSPGEVPAARPEEPPTVAGAVLDLVGALTGQGARTFVEEIGEHNRKAAGRRATRSDILADTSPTALATLAGQLAPHYQRLRMWRAARDLSARAAGAASTGASDPLGSGWSVERVRGEADAAQQDWLRSHGTLPYAPSEPDTAHGSGWEWGVHGALAITEAACELLRQLVASTATMDADYARIAAARGRVFDLRDSIEATRHQVDQAWSTDLGDGDDLVIGSLAPTRTYWTLRLAWFDYVMTGQTAWSGVRAAIAKVADSERDRRRRAHPDDEESAFQRGAQVAVGVERRLVSVAAAVEGFTVAAPETGGAVGRQLGLLAAAVAGEVVSAVAAAGPRTESSVTLRSGPESASHVHHWFNGLGLGPDLDTATVLSRLLHLEVVASVLGDEAASGASVPVELVQLSAQTRNAFARHSRTADEKLGGWSLHRFGGFLKRSWRANDWTWGRVDAATVLCRTVLQPARVRRAARNSGYLGSGPAHQLAQETVEELLGALFGEPGEDLSRLSEQAVEELAQVFDPRVEDGQLPAAFEALTDLFATAVHEQVVVEELPVLAAAVRTDHVEGGYLRSHGEVFLAAQESLLERLEEAGRDGASLVPAERRRALEAFDAAGIGRESLGEESRGDLTIRTATTAATVGASVLASPASGLKLLSGFTRAARGALLLPYWVVMGLTARSSVGRSLSLLGLAVGASLLALSLFGALPESFSAPAAAMGASAVLVAFGWAALRTSSLLHGVVLLSPVLPLLTYSVIRARTWEDEAAARGSTTLLVVLALAGVLVLLGSIGPEHGSVWWTLDRLADVRQVPRGRRAGVRWAQALAAVVAPFLLLLGGVVAVAAVVVACMEVDWVGQFRAWPVAGLLRWATVIGVCVAVLAAGTALAWWAGNAMRRLAPITTAGPDGETTIEWRLQSLTHRRGVVLGWSIVYGAGYVALALVLLLDPFDVHAQWWHRVALVGSVLFALTLVLVIPVLLPVLEVRDVARAEVGGEPIPLDPGAYAQSLAARGMGHAALVTEGTAPELRRLGRRLHRWVLSRQR